MHCDSKRCRGKKNNYSVVRKEDDAVSFGATVGHTTRTYAVDIERKKQNRDFIHRNDDCTRFWNDRIKIFGRRPLQIREFGSRITKEPRLILGSFVPV